MLTMTADSRTPNQTPSTSSRVLRWLAFGAGGLFLLLILLVVAVLFLVKPEDYQQLLVDQVRKSTGRELVLTEPLGLDLWPCCALAVRGASLGNPPGFPAGSLIEVDSARLGIRLVPLLTRRRVEIGQVTLEAPRLDLINRADGTDNWSFAELVGDKAGEAEGKDAADDEPLTLEVAGIRIRDGRLRWRDEADGSDYEVSALELETGPLGEEGPVPVTASLRLDDRKEGLGADLKLAGGLSYGPPPDAGSEAPAEARFADLRLDFAVTGLVEELTLVRGSATGAAARLALEPAILLAAPALDVDVVLEGPDLPEGGATLKGSLSALEWNGDSGAVRVGELSGDLGLAGATLKVTARGRLGTGPKDPDDFSGTLGVPGLSPREFLARLDPAAEPLETADPDALTRLSGTARWSLKGDDLALEAIDLKLDDSHITGNLRHDLAEPSRTRVDLALDRLDLDRYLAPETPGDTRGDGGKGTEVEVTELPLDTLRDLAGEGRIRIGQLRYAGLTVADLKVSARAGDGQLRLTPVTAQLYGGSYAGRITLDARQPAARLSLEQDINNLRLGSFLRDFAEVDNVDGVATGSVRLEAMGRTESELMASLGGALNLRIDDGVYRGTDLWYEIRRARALIRREAAPAAPANPSTPLETVELSGPIRDGVFRSDKFLAQVPHIRLTGKLGLNLPAETIDGDLVAQVYEAPVFEDGSSLPDLAGVRIPLTVKGPLADPSVRPDLQKMVREAGKEAIRDAADEAAGKLLQRLQKRLGGSEATGEAPAAGEAEGATPDGAEPAAPSTEKKAEKKDAVRDALDKLFKGR
jgi:AsmA protein